MPNYIGQYANSIQSGDRLQRPGGNFGAGKGTNQNYALPEPQPAEPTVDTDPATWDYRTSPVNMEGQPLPEGAIGWRPNGEAYYGDGPAGWWKQTQAKLNSTWDEYYKAGQLWDKEAGTSFQAPFTATINTARVGFSELLFGGLNALGSLASLTEQTAGFVGFTAKDIVYGKDVDLKTNWEAGRLAYSAVAADYKPVVEAWSKVPVLGYFAAKSLQQDGFLTKMKNGDQMREEFTRRMNSGEAPELIAEDMQMKGDANIWVDMGGQLIFDPLNAFDMVAKTPRAVDKLLNRQLTTAGAVTKAFATAEAPEVAKLIETMRAGEKADDIGALKRFETAYEDARAASTGTRQMVDVLQKPGAITRTAEMPDRVRNFAKYIPESRNTLFNNRAGAIMQSVVLANKDPNDALDIVEALVKLGGADEAASRQAFQHLLNQPNASILLSEAGNETGAVLAHLFEKEGANWIDDLKAASEAGGAEGMASVMLKKLHAATDDLFPSAIDLVKAADAVKDPAVASQRAADVAEAEKGVQIAQDALLAAKGTKGEAQASEALGKAVAKLDKSRRSVNQTERWAELASRMSPFEQKVARFHAAAQKGAVGTINKFLSDIYMGKSPAFAIRNGLNNQLQIFLDYGVGTAAANADRAMEEASKWNGLRLSVAGYGDDAKALDAATDVIKKTEIEGTGWVDQMRALFTNDKGNLGFDSRRWSEVIERRGAKQIVGTTYTKTFKEAITPLVTSLRSDKQFAGMSDEAWKVLEREIYNNYGNADAALAGLKKTMQTGVVDEFAQLDNVPKALRDYVSQTGHEQEFIDTVLRAKSKDEAAAALDNIFTKIDKDAQAALVTPVHLNPGDPLHDGLAVAFEEGIETPARGRLVAAQQQIANEAMGRAADVFDAVDDTLNGMTSGGAIRAKAKKLWPNLFKYAKDGERYGQRTMTTNRELLAVVNNVLGMANTDRNKMAAAWEIAKKTLNLTGDMPKNLAEYKSAVWNGYFAASSANWAADVEKRVAPVGDFLKFCADRGVPVDQKLYDLAADAAQHAEDAKGLKLADFGVMVKDGLPEVKNTTEWATSLAKNRYGLEFKNPKHLLNTVNKYGEANFKTLEGVSQELIDRALAKKAGKLPSTMEELSATARKAKPTNLMDKAAGVPRSELPEYVSKRFADEAKSLMNDISAGTGPGVSVARQGTGEATTAFGTSNVPWFRELPDNMKNKNTLDNALQKIIEDQGKDKGVTVERAKDFILSRFSEGDAATGTPPDLFVLQEMGAPENVMKRALDNFNSITGNDFTLEQAIDASAPMEAKLHDPNFGYFTDDGVFIPAPDAPKGHKYEPQVKPVAPPIFNGSQPTMAEALYHSNYQAVKEKLGEYVTENFGRVSTLTTKENAELLDKLAPVLKGRLEEVRIVSARVAEENRNFTLLNYGMKTYTDVATAYLMPYGFWYKGTYGTWMKRAIQNPSLLAHYAKYKNAMAVENAGLPDWWKQNIRVDNVFGIPLDNPFYFNLEATLWPLNGLTGEDFNDPQKAVNWWTSGLDNLGKFGPSIWTPINMMTGLVLRAQGETEAADRWLGRVIPQTSLAKNLAASATNAYLNTKTPQEQAQLQNNGLVKFFGNMELDPVVGLLQGGSDPYERRRIGRSLADMVANGTITQEQGIDAARSQTGPIWEAAQRNSNASRAMAQSMSTLFGVGFKPRTQSDMAIDQFDAEYRKLMSMKKGGYVSDDYFREQMAQLGQKYPFMDTVLISRRGGPDRDAALGYNVLGRIPPGEAAGLFEQVGINNDMVNQFYKDKGDMSAWTEGDRMRMTAAFVDLAATFQMADLPTRQDWNAARSMYNTMRDEVKKQLGADIWDKVNLYYGTEDKFARDALKQQMPEIQQALDLKSAYVSNNELLYKYYGGVDTIQSYFESEARAKAAQKYGEGIFALSKQYMEILDPKVKKEFMKGHPELKAYYADKKVWDAEVVKNTVAQAARMPTRADVPTRTDTALSGTQQALAGQVNQQAMTADQWAQALGPELMMFIQDGGEIPYSVKQRLDYLSSQYGYFDGDSLLEAVLISLQKR